MGKFLHLTQSPRCRRMLLAAMGVMLSVLATAPSAYAADGPGVAVQELRKEEGPRISITVKNASLEQVLLLLKKKTSYYFLYNTSTVSKISGLNFDLKNAGIDAVLTVALRNTDLEYQINNETIVIKARNEKTPPQQSTEPQKRELSGVVISKLDKQPLAGVSVYVRGAYHGTVTDSQGQYQLSFEPRAGQVIVFSFVGMEPQEIAYTGQARQNVTLAEKAEDVQSVVVTGYAPIKKESFTGNSVSISKEELQQVSKTNVLKAIQTFDPSFRMVDNAAFGSDPNRLPEVYIRGESGIGNKDLDLGLDNSGYAKANLTDNPNLPVFIMDGFQITAQKLYDMDPNRIENITILKDAAATAIYGSRAANGVVVITTVAPKPGKFNVSYNMVGTVVAPDLSDYNLMNAAEKLELERIAGCFMADPTNSDYSETSITRRQEYDAKRAAVARGVDTYWLGKPVRTAFNHKHSLYIDGGSETLRFGVDMQYTNQDGAMKGSKRDRVGAGFYLQYTYKNISIRNYASYTQTDSEESPYGSFSNFTTALPYDEIYDENGNYLKKTTKWSGNSPDSRENPLYESGLHNFDRSRTQEFIDNLSLTWNITPYLLLRGQMSITRTFGDSDRFYDPLSLRNSIQQSLDNQASGTLYTVRDNKLSYDVQGMLSYTRSFAKHNINAQAVVNVLDNSSNSLAINYFGFPSGALSSPTYAQQQLNKPERTEGTTRSIGFMGAVNYSYNNIYLLDLSCRMDGSSAFGRDKRFAPFWSAGVGLNVHNYESVRDGLPFLSKLRLRGSYGQTGKINFPPYAARTSYRVMNDDWYKTGFGTVLKAIGNSNLKWETTNTIDVGFEMGLWDNRITADFSFYNKQTVDLINDVTIPSSTGFTSYRDNIGEIRNRGVELIMRVTAVRQKDFLLVFNANLAHNKNRLMKVSESLKEYNRRVQDMIDKGSLQTDDFMSKPFMQYVEGISTNSIWGMKSLGINPATGEEVFQTLDGQLTDKWTSSQQQVLGVKDPTVQGSFGFSLVWKQFSLYTTFLYEAGGQRYNQTLADKVEGVNIYTSNVDRRVLSDRWSTPGQRALYKKMETGRTGVFKTQPTSRFVQNYNMLEFTSLTLGYDFKRSTIAPLHLSMLRIEVGANDLFHVSSVKQERGLSYPYARNFTFSIRAAF